MLKNKIAFFVFIIISFVTVGCASTKVKGYIEDRPRVDQELSGNTGYLSGSGSKQQPGKPTRKVFVVEIQKEGQQNEMDEMNTKASASSTSVLSSASEYSSDDIQKDGYPHINLPTFREQPQTAEGIQRNATSSDSKYIEYVVEKDDTLQKLGKKFYDSYSKWTKIYEANKSVIKNPDFIKPGITLKIPTEE